MPTETEKETSTEAKCREDLKTACNLAYTKGLLSGNEGNLSIRISNEFILVTPTKSNKGLIETKDFVIVDINGNIISNGNREPTTELALHLEAYQRRPDIKAILHAHPPKLTSFSVAGLDFNLPVIPEIIVLLGEVPTVPYREPGTEKLASLVGEYLEKHDAVILERHGGVTLGKDIFDAYNKMESLEHAANIMYSAHTLGNIQILDKSSLEELVKQRHRTHGKEVELREGSKLFQSSNRTLKFQNTSFFGMILGRFIKK